MTPFLSPAVKPCALPPWNVWRPFQAAGGRLIFLGNAPQLEDARPSGRGQALYQAALQVPFAREAVLEALRPVRMVELRNKNGTRTENLLHQLRRDGDGLWLFHRPWRTAL